MTFFNRLSDWLNGHPFRITPEEQAEAREKIDKAVDHLEDSIAKFSDAVDDFSKAVADIFKEPEKELPDGDGDTSGKD